MSTKIFYCQKPGEIGGEQFKLYDINRKMEVAKLIVKGCMMNTINRENIEQNKFYLTAKNFTVTSDVLNLSIFETIIKKQRPQTFSDWFKEISPKRDESYQNMTYGRVLRKIFVDYYVYKSIIPTIKSISHEFAAKGMCFTIKEIKKLLKINGYKTQRLPHSTATIIIENPEQRLKKMTYLSKLIHSKNLDRHLVYVKEKIIKSDVLDDEKNNEIISIHIAVSSVMGLIAKHVQIISADSNEKYTKIEDWVLNTVLPFLSMPSIIVLESGGDCTKFKETPSVSSKKSEIIDWLKRNDIPHVPEMHTAELYELIKRSKSKFDKEKYKLDEILKGHGHEVLVRPYPSNYFWDRINAEKTGLVDKYFTNIKNLTLLSVSLEGWIKLAETFYETELKLYNEMNLVDEVIDKILTYAKYETIPEQYLRYCDYGIDEVKLSEVVLE